MLAMLGAAQAQAQERCELIGQVRLEGTARDRSGLPGESAPGYPQDLLGGFSALRYTGHENRYILLPDRGPGDGAASYPCRFHVVEIEAVPQPGGAHRLEFALKATHLLRDEHGVPWSGSQAARSAGRGPALRLDPEGLAAMPDGGLLVSDEYGPHLVEFLPDGAWKRALRVPSKFLIAHPAASKDDEAARNSRGRQPNRGFEGATLTPGGGKLFAVAQGPLTQDAALADGKRRGRFARVVEFDLPSGATREYVFPLVSPKYGVSEILAINETEFLVLERDGEAGGHAKYKRILRANLAEATDVSGIDPLPAEKLPSGVAAMKTAPFLDLMDSRYGLAGDDLPEKFEGLTFGPKLPDGRLLLLVAVDNDFQSNRPSLILAFAVDPQCLPGYGWPY
jgi:hypothetical protein